MNRNTLALCAVLVALLCTAPGMANAQLDTSRGNSFAARLQDRPQPLPIERAFRFYVAEISPTRYQVSWTLAEDHYLYQHSFRFRLQQGEGSDPVEIPFQLPEGVAKNDQFFGDIVAYYDEVRAELSLPAPPASGATLLIEYQGCAEWGFCYPPATAEFTLISP